MIERIATFLKARGESGAGTDEEVAASAVAILKLLRKPAKEQLVATENVVVGHDDFSCGEGAIYLSYPNNYGTAALVWQTMIDAALEGEAA